MGGTWGVYQGPTPDSCPDITADTAPPSVDGVDARDAATGWPWATAGQAVPTVDGSNGGAADVAVTADNVGDCDAGLPVTSARQ